MKRTKKLKAAPPSLLHFADRHVLAFDLSLQSTGWANDRSGAVEFGTLPATTARGMERLRQIQRTITAAICNGDLPLVVFEDCFAGGHAAGSVERIGLAYLIRMDLWTSGIPYVLVAPATLKKFAAGAGFAKKEQVMLEVYKRWGHSTTIDDEADACALYHLGRQLVGAEEPQNQAQRECLLKVEVVARPEVLNA